MQYVQYKATRGNTPTPTSEPAVQHSVRKTVTFAAAPTQGEMNDESQGEIGVIIPHDDANSDEMVEQQVGVHTVSGTADAYTDYDAIDTPEENVEPEPSPRRTMMDMSRNGTGETALTTSNIYDTEEKIGGDPSDFVMNITVKNALKTRGEGAERVVLKELSQMMCERVWEPVHVSSINGTDRSRIIRSQMFLKEKFLPTREFERLKARPVAGGDQQDKNLYGDLSSPTVSTSAVLAVLSIAAFERRKVSVVDISGAYLNANVGKEVTVRMRLDQLIASMMIKLSPDYGKKNRKSRLLGHVNLDGQKYCFVKKK